MRFTGTTQSKEHKNKRAEAIREKKRPDLVGFNRRRALQGGMSGANNPNYGKHHSEEAKEKIRQKHLAYITRTPIEERRLSEETKRQLSETRKKQWQDPEYVAKLIKAMALSPNGLERKLIDLFEKHLPEFKYNGDFSEGVMLGGLVPDFVNINGKKQVIEVFGDYWHSPNIIGDDWRRSELGKVMIYNSVGWKCLVIWENDIKKLTEEEILNKITKFSTAKGR